MDHIIDNEQIKRYYEKLGQDGIRWTRFFNNFSDSMRTLKLKIPGTKVTLNVVMKVQRVEFENEK